MPDHEERPPTALARGAAKSSDIERVRRNVDQAEVRVTHDAQTSTARRRRLRGPAQGDDDAQP
jgi:hypothetical protein